jgi:outer membrane protein OmpA-like peptidoglycan-associated protein
MSDSDRRRNPDFDRTAPNIKLPQNSQQPSAPRARDEFDRTMINYPAGGEAGRQPAPPAGDVGNKFDLTLVGLRLPPDDDEPEDVPRRSAAAPRRQPAVAPYPEDDYESAQYQQPAQTVPLDSRAPARLKFVLWGLLGFVGLLVLLGAGLAAYLLWPSQTFTLKVMEAPHGSKLYVDDVPIGVSQADGTIVAWGLRPGELRDVRVARDGYVDWRTTVQGEDGRTKELRVKMMPLPKTEAALPQADDQIEQDLDAFGRARVFGIRFDTGSDVIKDDSKPQLDTIVAILKKRADWSLTIEGHTDSLASAQYNQELSQRRAAAVKSYLQARGIAGSRLSTVGFGASRPVASNETPVGRALNRRVELVRQ